jgi:hypothetical protein
MLHVGGLDEFEASYVICKLKSLWMAVAEEAGCMYERREKKRWE